jgi:hypothetical protein
MSVMAATRVQDIPAEACWSVFEAINAAWLRSANGWPHDYLQNIDRFVDVAKGRCDKLPDEVAFHPMFMLIALHFYGVLYKQRASESALPTQWPHVPDKLAALGELAWQDLDKRPIR